MRSTSAAIVALLLLAVATSASFLPKGLKIAKKGKGPNPSRHGRITCDGPALAVFDKFAQAYVDRNLTAAAAMLDDGFYGLIAISGRWMDKTTFMAFITESQNSHGTTAVFETERMDGGNVGAVKFHSTGFNAPNSSGVYDYNTVFYFVLNAAGTQMIQAVELIAGANVQANQTESINAIRKLGNASEAGDVGVFNSSLSSDFMFEQSVCGQGPASLTNRSGFIADITAHFKQQLAATIVFRNFFVNGNLIFVPFTNFWRANVASGGQQIIEAMTFWELEGDGSFKIRRLVELMAPFW
jgi:hypothetical protein